MMALFKRKKKEADPREEALRKSRELLDALSPKDLRDLAGMALEKITDD